MSILPRPRLPLQRWIGAAALALAPLWAQALEYQLTEVDPLSPDTPSWPRAVDRHGWVVGDGLPRHRRFTQAMLFRPGKAVDIARRGGLAPVHYGTATSINTHGVIAGFLQFRGEPQGVPFIDDHGQVTLLPNSPTAPKGTDGIALGINGLGDVVGRRWSDEAACVCAFAYHQGTFTTLPGPAGTTASGALGVNDSGWAVGEIYNGQNLRRAAVWHDGVLVAQPSLGGNSDVAVAVNADGVVVGNGFLPNRGQQHAFVYRDGTTTDIDGDPQAGSTAYAINRAGTVVGWRYDAAHNGAFVNIKGKMHWLNRLLVAEQRPLWKVNIATAINDAGQIVAVAYRDKDTYRVVLLTPVRP